MKNYDPNGNPYSSTESLTDNRRVYEGAIDLAQDWIGPRVPTDSENYTKAVEEIARVFTHTNFVRQCIDRHASALTAKLPKWYLKQTISLEEGKLAVASEDKALSAYENIIQAWIDKESRRACSAMSRAYLHPLHKAVLDACIDGCGYIRVYSLDYVGNSQPINTIGVHSPAPGSVKVFRNGDRVSAIEYRYSHEGKARVERQVLDYSTGLLTVEITEESAEKNIVDSFTTNLGGNYTIQEVRLNPLITEDVKSLQRGVFLDLTMLTENGISAGWLERIFINAHVDKGVDVGAGRVLSLHGIQTVDPNTMQTSTTTPSVIFRQPVEVRTFLDSIFLKRNLIYDSFSQSFMLNSGDGTLSGVSRIHIKDDWVGRLTRDKLAVEVAWGNTIAVVLNYIASKYQRVPKSVEGIEPVVEGVLSLGRPLPEEVDLVIKVYQANLIAQTTAMQNTGYVEDPDAELELMRREREEAIEAGVAALVSAERSQLDGEGDEEGDVAQDQATPRGEVGV